MNITEENKKIAEHYGFEAQSNQLIEECAELIQAVNKYKRATKEEVLTEKAYVALNNLVEEIADVEIMLGQIKHLLSIPEEDIQGVKIYKINRTKERIAGSKGE